MKVPLPLSKPLALACGLWLAAPLALHAQTADKKTAIGGNVSLLQYHGDLGSDFWTLKNRSLEFGGGIGITRYLSPSFDIGLYGNYENFKFDGNNVRPNSGFNARVGTGDLGLKLKLNNGKILPETAVVAPYIMAGGGGFWTNSDGTLDGRHYFNQIRRPELFGALGLRFQLSPSVALDIQTSQHYPLTDRLDNAYGGKLYDRLLLHSAGLTFALGKAKDEDKDGVPDRKDKCPGTPAGVTVDLTGCPVDGDGDGVPDYQDKCPTEKGLPSLEGCPDRDGDGVRDSEDKCPDQPGKAELQGCPDADGDGVIDATDKCPNTPAGTRVDATGCPLDRDNDGVPDTEDRCPDRPGPASNRGCPEVKAETRKVLNEATKYIQFEFNKAVLLPSSNAKLDELVSILSEYPDYNLSVVGHTDNVGNDAYNLRLSDERAAAVRTYMLGKGLEATRIESRGYGETKPIAPNTTKAGQALNRRVDIDLFLPGDANPGEAKYGPVPVMTEPAAPVKKAPARKAPIRRAAPVRKSAAKK